MVSIKPQHNITHASVGNAIAMLHVICQSCEFMSYMIFEGVTFTVRIRGFPFIIRGFAFRIRVFSLE